MILKELTKQIDNVVKNWLPLRHPFDDQLLTWANLHGWNILEIEYQRLLVYQALFNSTLLQATPGIEYHTFATPLDSLGITAPETLVSAAREAVQRSQMTTFNFWGELYRILIAQTHRRQIGQFWTNEAIAEWMVAWLLQTRPYYLADMGCGAGNFLLKAAQRLTKSDTTVLYGCDISPLLLNATLAAFYAFPLRKVEALPTLAVQNYLEGALPTGADAIICNPPYTRHHQIAPELKDRLQGLFKVQFRFNVSRQGTLAFYFLLKLITEMPDGARAAIIVPMETIDARYGQAAQRVLCEQTSLKAIIHFSPQMNAFQKVDVGASILLFKKGYEKQNHVCHLTLKALPDTAELLSCLENERSKKQELAFGSLVVEPQENLLDTPKWFSLATPPTPTQDWEKSGLVVPLRVLAKVVRGIATGANEFFALSHQKVQQYELHPYVVRTLQRNREVQDIIFDEAMWQALADQGKNVWLLYLNGEDREKQPGLQTYLAKGEAQGYHHRSLVQTRRKWYTMEQRNIPAIFFTILTRGNPRFILNKARVRPLNMFSLIYPNRYLVEAEATELLWALLNSTFSLSRLHSLVGHMVVIHSKSNHVNWIIYP